MKKFYLLILCGILSIGLASILGACSSDDDEKSLGVSDSNIVGVWRLTYYELIEDGEKYGGSFKGNEIVRMTLNADGSYVYYVNLPDDGNDDHDDDGTEYTDQGTWTLKGNVLTIVERYGSYFSTSEIIIKSLTEKSMVTYQYGIEDHYSIEETRTWKREK